MIIGHQHIIKFLNISIKKNRLAHAYLFAGPEHLGKETIAKEFVKSILCEKRKNNFVYCNKCSNCINIDSGLHPDFIYLEPRLEQKGKVIKKLDININQIRDLQHKLSLMPYSAAYKIAIIDEIDRLNQEAANCLLKTLEEPPNNSILILIAHNLKQILPTIKSRCQLIKFEIVNQKEIFDGLKAMNGIKSSCYNLEIINKLSLGYPGLAIKFLKERDSLKEVKFIFEELEKILNSDIS
ncbi:MAG: DNA polymerase III subunit delta', partial [Spirochaetota bacterium]|nr:DNA polymerase III subunit delta' [Spirochaetota bacterium]